MIGQYLYCVKCWFIKKEQRYADFVVAGDSKCWDCFNSEILEFRKGVPERRKDEKK